MITVSRATELCGTQVMLRFTTDPTRHSRTDLRIDRWRVSFAHVVGDHERRRAVALLILPLSCRLAGLVQGVGQGGDLVVLPGDEVVGFGGQGFGDGYLGDT